MLFLKEANLRKKYTRTLERISKKRTKNEVKTTKPDTEWKSVEKTKTRPSPRVKKSTQVNPDKSKGHKMLGVMGSSSIRVSDNDQSGIRRFEVVVTFGVVYETLVAGLKRIGVFVSWTERATGCNFRGAGGGRVWGRWAGGNERGGGERGEVSVGKANGREGAGRLS
ncbi:hypothetical protein Tco_1330105 [Tanacetum coccineum]